MMESRYTLFALSALGTAVLIASLAKLKTRLELSKAKHRSLAGHARMGKRIASLIPFYEYDEAQFFRADSAPDDIAARREAGFARLSKLYRDRFAAPIMDGGGMCNRVSAIPSQRRIPTL